MGSDGEVRMLTTLDELAEVGPLFEQVWGASGYQVAMPVNLLRALVHSGNYVGGVRQDGRLVAAAVGWIGRHDGSWELHSHAVGVARPAQGQGLGYAIKLHQRDWALANGLPRITWTFDPLGRRNAWFNLVKLGARGVAYYPDFYGPMPDELNGDDETDRCLVQWDLEGEPATAADDGPDLIRVEIPEDIVSLRRGDPARAREWRLAVRHAMGGAMADGYVATSVTPDGWYVLERPV